MSELSFEMRPQPGCETCGGSGFLPGVQHVAPSKIGPPICYHCNGTGKLDRQPTAILTVRGTAEAREGLPRFFEVRCFCPGCGQWDDQPFRHGTGQPLGYNPITGESEGEEECGPWKEITRKLLRWTGEEPLDLLALAEVYVEGCDCLGGHDPRECGGLASYSLPGVDGLILTDPMKRERELDDVHEIAERAEAGLELFYQAERLGIEVEYGE